MSIFMKLSFRKQNLVKMCLTQICSALLALVLLPTGSLCTSKCLVTSPAGIFEGFEKQSPMSPYIPFCSYLGIRYGRPPTGDNRFKESVLAEPLKVVKKSVVDGSPCPQFLKGLSVGSEDCLFLNVFTPYQKPENSKHALKPVIVYIHGGALLIGASLSALFSPDHLMEQDVIVVTLNYRLNLFGFLSLGIRDCGGNMGLRDQALALKWVQHNIRSFGGDPNSVTLMGESAGGWSSYLQTMSPKTRGLFGKVILQSPIATSFAKNFTEPNSLEFAKFVGYSGDIEDRLGMLKYLKRVPMVNLVKSFGLFSDKLYQTKISYNVEFTPFYPVIDSFLGEEAFLPQPEEELGKNVPAIPIIAGQTNLDGSAFFFPFNFIGDKEDVLEFNQRKNYSMSSGNQIQKSSFLEDIVNALPQISSVVQQLLFSTTNEGVIDRLKNNVEAYLDPVYTKNKLTKQEVEAKVINFYFNQNGENELKNAVDLYTDLQYYKFYEQMSSFSASYNKGKIYVYHFCYDSLNMFKVASFGLRDFWKLEGVGHAEDISYTFYSQLVYPIFLPTEKDKKIIRQFCKMLTNFAKFGDPNSDDVGLEDRWQPIRPSMKGHLRIDKETRFINTRIEEKRRQFWDNLPRSN